MNLYPEYQNQMEREAVYRIRELFANGREASLTAMETSEEAYLCELAEAALYPEKPLLSFHTGEEENGKNQTGELVELFRLAHKLRGKRPLHRLIACGGVDDGKSTLIGRILFDAKSRREQEEIRQNPVYLRKDGSVDFALLAGETQEEANQGITVQVSYSIFEWEGNSFLMADVPGHEEYTHNMALAALWADTAVIMTAANKGIVPQTRRHTRICHFMGIRTMVFAVNKMDMAAYDPAVFRQLSDEIREMMEEYPDCRFWIVPVAAKSGVNIMAQAKETDWYPCGTLLAVLQQALAEETEEEKTAYLPVQRTCKSSQMKGAEVKRRVIQGELAGGSLAVGDRLLIYPTGREASVSGIYCLNRPADRAKPQSAVGIELDRELDAARGYVLAKEDMLTVTDRVEADLLWISDNRLTQGRRYLAAIAAAEFTASVTKICYQTDVNTGEHRYAKHLTKNGLARCELFFSRQTAITCAKESRILGTIRLFERETGVLAACGNIVHTISEEAWKKDGREVTGEERESALGQKSGMILFAAKEQTKEQMNYTERYLLRMGFHTIQAPDGALDERKLQQIQSFLDAGLIVLLFLLPSEKDMLCLLRDEQMRLFDCTVFDDLTEQMGNVLKQIKEWASVLI